MLMDFFRERLNQTAFQEAQTVGKVLVLRNLILKNMKKNCLHLHINSARHYSMEH